MWPVSSTPSSTTARMRNPTPSHVPEPAPEIGGEEGLPPREGNQPTGTTASGAGHGPGAKIGLKPLSGPIAAAIAA